MKYFFRLAAIVGVILSFYEGAAACLWWMGIALAIDTFMDMLHIMWED